MIEPRRGEVDYLGGKRQIVWESGMLFMVIETFRNQDAKAIYRRLHEKGRALPDGLVFINSHVSADLGRCFQLMQASDITLLQRWVAEWSDLAQFEIVPVVAGSDTAAALAAAL